MVLSKGSVSAGITNGPWMPKNEWVLNDVIVLAASDRRNGSISLLRGRAWKNDFNRNENEGAYEERAAHISGHGSHKLRSRSKTKDKC